MTKNESTILTEVATDIKWLKRQHEEATQFTSRKLDKIEAHLSDINGGLAKNCVQTAVNKSNVNRLWWFTGILIASIISVVLKVFGVF